MAESTGAVPKQVGQQQQPQRHPNLPPPLRNVVDINQFSHCEAERWICIYPAYLNSMKSRSQGRLVPKEKAVFNPTWMECRDVLAPKGFRFCIENKSYPRERSREPHFRGRIRLQLKDESGQPLNPEFKTRLDVMYFICENIPKLKGRQEMARRAAESVSEKSGGGGSGGGGGGGPGKKNKKKK